MLITQNGANFNDACRRDIQNRLIVFETASFDGGAKTLYERNDEGVFLQ
jgi:hypothetical protein